MNYDIDLRWSLWTSDIESLKEVSSKLATVLSEGFQNGFKEDLSITTAPSKEIRYGSIHICAETGEVTVRFSEVWDALADLVETLEMLSESESDQEEARGVAEDTLFAWFDCEMSASDTFDDGAPMFVEVVTFPLPSSLDQFMIRVDQIEDCLLRRCQEIFQSLETKFKPRK